MTEASRCGGKIKFIMPDDWTQEQTDKLADNVLEQVAPKITKLAKPKKKKEGGIINLTPETKAWLNSK